MVERWWGIEEDRGVASGRRGIGGEKVAHFGSANADAKKLSPSLIINMGRINR